MSCGPLSSCFQRKAAALCSHCSHVYFVAWHISFVLKQGCADRIYHHLITGSKNLFNDEHHFEFERASTKMEGYYWQANKQMVKQHWVSVLSIPSMTSVSIGAVFLGENCQKVMRKKEMIWKLLNSTLEGWDMQKRWGSEMQKCTPVPKHFLAMKTCVSCITWMRNGSSPPSPENDHFILGSPHRGDAANGCLLLPCSTQTVLLCKQQEEWRKNVWCVWPKFCQANKATPKVFVTLPKFAHKRTFWFDCKKDLNLPTMADHQCSTLLVWQQVHSTSMCWLRRHWVKIRHPLGSRRRRMSSKERLDP